MKKGILFLIAAVIAAAITAYADDSGINVAYVDFTDKNGRELQNLEDVSNGIKITAEVENYSQTPQNIEMISALYDGENDALKAVEIETVSAVNEHNNRGQITLESSGINKNDYIRVFFWNLSDGMRSAEKAFSFPADTDKYDRKASEYTAVCGSQTDMSDVGAVNWNRIDFAWQSVQPTENGGFSETQLKKWGDTILECRKNGITMLPILDYTADWAADPSAYEYVSGTDTYKYSEAQEIEGKPSYWTRELTVVKQDGTETVSTVTQRKSRQRFRDVKLWEAYVEKIVSTYSAEPYNLKYFQIWNEAHPKSSFWDGGMEYYMTVLHKSAADIIHKYGCEVVYGGWPSIGGIGNYCDMLDKYDAWKTTDIFDLHYYNTDNMYTVYKRALKAGVKSPKVWQTEIGWISNPGYICSMYSRLMYMALMNRSEQNDQFKAFYFTWGAPNDPNAYGYGKVLKYTDGTLTYHGKSMKMFSETMRGNSIERYTRISTGTGIGYAMTGNTIHAFEIDKRKIAAVFAADINDKTVKEILGEEPIRCEGVFGTKSVQLASYDGSEYHSLDFTDDKNGNISFTIPENLIKTYEYNGSKKAIFYIIINAAEITAPTSNIRDFEYGSDSENNKSLIVPGRWSYVDCYYASPRPLSKGTGAGKFSADTWTVDNKKSVKSWCLDSNGNINTDTRAVGYNYTIGESMSGKSLTVKGTFNPNGRKRSIKIYKTNDTDAYSIAAEKELIFEYSGKDKTEFNIGLHGEYGNDILFEVKSVTAGDYGVQCNLNAEVSAN